MTVGDLGFTGNLYWNYQGQPITFLVVYYKEIQWVDPGQDGRADLVIPVGYSTDPNLMSVKNVKLIFHNNEKLNKINSDNGVMLQHWNPNPDILPMVNPPNPYSADGIIVNASYNINTPGAILFPG